jgi:hypothetical protein
MSCLLDRLSQSWQTIQGTLFPWLKEELGELTEKQQSLVTTLEIIRLENYLYQYSGLVGRPLADRVAIASAFVAKAVYNMGTTRLLLDRLDSDISLRRICGWERKQDIPSESTFSRAFAEFSESQLPELIHETLIKEHLGDRVVGHISRDSTAINSREKPETKPKKDKAPKKRGRPKKGEVREKKKTRLQKQAEDMTLDEMLEDLPTSCNVGTKKNSKGNKESWIGYKLHIDSADGGIPITCLLTSASMHDSQAAIPLSYLSASRVDSCYDLMDAAYDSVEIKEQSEKLGHIPIIDTNPRRDKALKDELKNEASRQRIINQKDHKAIRYNERSTVERVNGRLKDEFGGRVVRVKGNKKVMCHLMFGIVALTVDQLMKFIQ